MTPKRIYNKIFDEAIYEQVNPRNKELLADFVLELRGNKRSPNTINQYTYNLRSFFCHLYRRYENRFVLELTKKEFKAYALSLIDEYHVSNARRNGIMSIIRSLLEYAEMDEDWAYENNQVRLIKGLGKDPTKPIIFLTDDQVTILFDRLTKAGKLQEACLLSLAYDSVGRRNELAQVEKDCLIKSFQDPKCHNTNIVEGKGGKKFPLFFFERTSQAAKAWLEQRGEDDIPSLFIEDNNGPRRAAIAHDVYEMFTPMRKYLSDLLNGAEKDFACHSMRHSGMTNVHTGTHWVSKKYGLPPQPTEKVQLLAHHGDPSTTQSYFPDTSNEEIAGMFGITIQ